MGSKMGIIGVADDVISTAQTKGRPIPIPARIIASCEDHCQRISQGVEERWMEELG